MLWMSKQERETLIPIPTNLIVEFCAAFQKGNPQILGQSLSFFNRHFSVRKGIEKRMMDGWCV